MSGVDEVGAAPDEMALREVYARGLAAVDPLDLRAIGELRHGFLARRTELATPAPEESVAEIHPRPSRKERAPRIRLPSSREERALRSARRVRKRNAVAWGWVLLKALLVLGATIVVTRLLQDLVEGSS